MSAHMTKEPKKATQQELYEMIGSASITTAPLNNSHRCDRCGAQALVRSELGNLKLLFCAHHARMNIPAMLEKDWKFDDQSDRLLN